jgi:hypothetical protein
MSNEPTVTDADDDLADEIETAINDSIDMDWRSSWAVPAILAIIHRHREAAYEAGKIEGVRIGLEAVFGPNDPRAATAFDMITKDPS